MAALYRKLPHPEPTAEIDAAVLAMAHRAVRSSTRTPHARWLPRLGIAAAVLLAASVAIRVGPQIWNEHTLKTERAADKASKEAAPGNAPSAGSSVVSRASSGV